jgi:isopentenyl-diphosphate delta-isomerase
MPLTRDAEHPAHEVIVGVDESGSRYPIDKLDAHLRSTRHLAVSVFVFRDGRLLLQQRADGKYHSGGLWANTCCSHPRWDETPAACAERRLREELGFSVPLAEFARIEYATPVGALFENEAVHCFQGMAGPDLDTGGFNRDEVQAVAWRDLEELAHDMAQRPDRYAAWFHIYMARHHDAQDAFTLLPASSR